MLKAAIDTGPLSTGDSIRGIGTYVRELTKHLKDVEPVDISSKDLSSLKKFGVIHFTKFNPFRISVPFSKPVGVKFVLTIYDLIPLIYKDHYPPGIKGWISWQINKFLIKRNIDAVITISETSKKDICRIAGVSPPKVYVTYLAASDNFKKITDTKKLEYVRNKYSLPKNFILYVGDINYNKNIPNLISAARILKKPLVIAGKQAVEIEKMDLHHPELVHLKNLDWTGVYRLGFVSEEDLVVLFNLADVFVQPSFYEGFGLGVLQAIACDTPAACSKTQALVEIAGEACEYFDPKNSEEIASAIERSKLFGKLPREYTWDKTAQATKEIYEKI